MKRVLSSTYPLLLTLIVALNAWGQLGLFSSEQRIAFTREWTGERFADGRPKVPDSILERMSEVTAEEAWGVLQEHHYLHHFESGWKQFSPTGKRMVGRIVTAMFMPIRPDVNAVIVEKGKAENRVGSGQGSWAIDTLVPGDVLVVDMFGKIEWGTFMGDNLGTSIFTKSKNGVVINGAARDRSGLEEIKGFTGFVRDFHPTYMRNVMLMGINVPIRIGDTTVMPGDVVLSDPEGLMFIPAQLAETVVKSSELIRMRDQWGHQMLREGKYRPGQIDSTWTKEMEEEFSRWADREKANKGIVK